MSVTMRGRRASQRIGALLTWLTAGALALSLVMIVGLLALVAWNGASAFFARPIELLTLYHKYGLMPAGTVMTGPGFVTKDTAAQVIELSAAGIR